MADLLKTGLAWLSDQLATQAATDVTYRRGASEVVVPATFGAKLLKLADIDGGIVMQWTDMDFCIRAADLVLDNVAVTPKRGDQIDVATAAGTQTFEVFPFGGEPPWRYSDPHQSMVRVHTKRIGSLEV